MKVLKEMLLMENVQLFLKYRIVEGNGNPAGTLHKWFSSASNSLGFAKLAKDSSPVFTIFLHKSYAFQLPLVSGSCGSFSPACSGPENNLLRVFSCSCLRVSVQLHLHVFSFQVVYTTAKNDRGIVHYNGKWQHLDTWIQPELWKYQSAINNRLVIEAFMFPFFKKKVTFSVKKHLELALKNS